MVGGKKRENCKRNKKDGENKQKKGTGLGKENYCPRYTFLIKQNPI